MYKIIILTTLFISNSLYAMDNMHDHNSKQHDHNSHVAVDGSKTELDDAMYDNFVSDLGSSQVVIVDVNGMVCDFCARALEKVFSEKQEVAAIDVDLDNGKISINFNDGASLDDSLIQKLVTNSGYDVVKINRCERG